MGELADWLRAQDLGRLEEILVSNDIDLDVLSELGEQDLVSLGLSLGDRKRLLRAIRARAEDAGVARQATPGTAQSPPAERVASQSRTNEASQARPAAADAGAGVELRHLVIMFCDLVDSTRMADELDPEDVSKLLRNYHACARDAVESFGGQIAQYLGDGVLAYFGYPAAHEDDAERAARASFSLLERLASASVGARVQLQARVGLAAGPVVMHEMMRIEGWSNDNAVGKTINLAARLQTEAEPGSIVVDGSVRRALGTTFSCTALGERLVKGFAKPVELWRLGGGAAGALRFESTRRRYRGAMVGRTEELRVLQRHWSEAEAGRGSAIVLTADAGLGKSRLLHELRALVRPRQELIAQCISYSSGTAYLPLIEALRGLAGFEKNDSPEAQRTKIDALASAHEQLEPRLLGALRYLLDLAGADEEISKVSAEVRQARISESLRALFLGLSRKAALLLVVEDLHWSDRATEVLLASLVTHLADHRILFVATRRPEHRLPWLGRPGVLELSIPALAKHESRQLLGGLLDGDVADERYLEAIASRAEGNPLFLEELALAHDDEASGDLLPQSVQSLMMSRIDALPKTLRRALQTASVLGREFRRQVFQAVWEQADKLADLILEMEQLQLLYERLERDESVLTFRHALIQDAAYGTLVRSRRRELHLNAARAIERLFTSERRDVAAMLAHHYACAGQPTDAIGHLLTLTDQALASYALEDAESNLRKALQLAGSIEPASEARKHRWGVQAKLAQVLYLLGRFQESIDLLEAERAELEGGEHPGLSAPCLFWLAHMFVRRARYDDTERTATSALQQAARTDDGITRGKALGVLCLRSCLLGDSSEAVRFGSESIELLQSAGQQYWLAMSRFYVGMLHVQIGALGQAAEEGLEVTNIGQSIGDPRLQCYGFFLRSWALADSGESSALEDAKRSLALAPDPTSRAYATGFLGYARLRSGDARAACEQLEVAAGAIERIGFRPFESLFLAYLSEAQRQLGATDAAVASARRAIEAAERWSYPLGEAWARRALSRAEMQAEPTVSAESMRIASRIFERIGAAHQNSG